MFTHRKWIKRVDSLLAATLECRPQKTLPFLLEAGLERTVECVFIGSWKALNSPLLTRLCVHMVLPALGRNVACCIMLVKCAPWILF